jgi:hypothetical protein
MGLFFNDDSDCDYDYKRLRKDLENEFFCQGVAFSGDFGMFEMMEASGASNEKLLKMAKREGFDLRKYRR